MYVSHTCMQTARFFTISNYVALIGRISFSAFLGTATQTHTYTRSSDRILDDASTSRLTFWYYCFCRCCCIFSCFCFLFYSLHSSVLVYVKGRTEMTKRNEATIKGHTVYTRSVGLYMYQCL